MARGAVQRSPPLVDSVKYTCGLVISPLTYVMTMRFVASAPVGAPLAMSTLGAGARSLRAPAMPAQTCSLSENVVEDCRETTTGFVQAFLSFAAAAATLSVRETAIASKPLNTASSRVAPRFEVRLA